MSKIIYVPMPVKNAKNEDNAEEIMRSIYPELEVECLGCKDNGISWEDIEKINQYIKKTGKKSLLEVMADEDHWINSAQMAVGFGFDIVIGTHYSKAVADLLAENQIEYYPFIGKLTEQLPIIMQGTVEGIVSEAVYVSEQNVTGLTIPLYHFEGNVDDLARKLIANVKKPMFVAGHVSTEDQIRYLNELGYYGFTMGTQLIDKKYVPDGSFIDNLNYVADMVKRI